MRKPTKRELLRPWELLAGALLLSAFVAVIVLAGTRNLSYAAITLGGVFIIALMGLSMFSLAIKPDAEELADIAVLDREQYLKRGDANLVATAPIASTEREAEPGETGDPAASSSGSEPASGAGTDAGGVASAD